MSSILISSTLGNTVPFTMYNAPVPVPKPETPRKRTSVFLPKAAADWLRT